jgi:hypothetical protein
MCRHTYVAYQSPNLVGAQTAFEGQQVNDDKEGKAASTWHTIWLARQHAGHR